MNVGRHQGLGPSELTELVQTETEVVEEQMEGVEIRNSYSFFNVPAETVDSVIGKLSGKSFGDREVRIERAKK
jgi:hypothetical protein